MIKVRSVEMLHEFEVGSPMSNPRFDEHIHQFMNVVQNGEPGVHKLIFIDEQRGDFRVEFINVEEA